MQAKLHMDKGGQHQNLIEDNCIKIKKIQFKTQI